MPLTNKQYDTIMRGYDHKQCQNFRQQCAHKDEIYQKIPKIQEIDAKISSFSVLQAEKLFFINSREERQTMLSSLQKQLYALSQEKKRLLQENGYPEDYLEMHYTCPDCKDTGYIGGKKCHCFQNEEIRLLYSDSRLEAILANENFSTLSFDAYDSEQKKIMPSIIHTCHDFVNTIHKEFHNLFLYGSVGTGKTFLSNCIAKELLDKGYSVIYFTAFQLFEHFTPNSSGEPEDFRQNYSSLLDSNLLILDDLGTELVNTFTVSKLFQVLNERALRQKPTIISTNLSLKDFRDIYSERIFSRITSSYTLLKFSGSDIRIRRKIYQTGDCNSR